MVKVKHIYGITSLVCVSFLIFDSRVDSFLFILIAILWVYTDMLKKDIDKLNKFIGEKSYNETMEKVNSNFSEVNEEEIQENKNDENSVKISGYTLRFSIEIDTTLALKSYYSSLSDKSKEEIIDMITKALTAMKIKDDEWHTFYSSRTTLSFRQFTNRLSNQNIFWNRKEKYLSDSIFPLSCDLIDNDKFYILREYVFPERNKEKQSTVFAPRVYADITGMGMLNIGFGEDFFDEILVDNRLSEFPLIHIFKFFESHYEQSHLFVKTFPNDIAALLEKSKFIYNSYTMEKLNIPKEYILISFNDGSVFKDCSVDCHEFKNKNCTIYMDINFNTVYTGKTH
jgi:hypothetical protein